MKSLHLICICLLSISVLMAQNNKSEIQQYSHQNGSAIKKVTIRLMDNRTVSGQVVSTTDSCITVMLHHDTSGEQYQTIPASQIRLIKVKKNAFWMGAVGGAVLGAVVGYNIGKVPKEQNQFPNDEEEDDVVKGITYAGIAMVPTALAGSLIGSTFIKRRYRVDGSMEKYKKVIQDLSFEIF